jgi:hypothetical protein
MRLDSLRMALVALACLALAGCSEQQRAIRAEDYRTVPVKFPNGKEIRAEQMINRQDLANGMMFREALAENRGMLFYHGKEGNYAYWMFQVKVPLDLIWLDKSKKIVQIVHKAPPCPGPRQQCPSYGGAFPASYVLEVPAGTAAANGLKPGMMLDF